MVISNDLKNFVANVPRLFPGAKVSVAPDDTASSTRATKLLTILNDRNLPTKLTTKDVSRLLGLKAPWYTVSHNILTPKVLKAIEALGWEYRRNKGRKGSWFEKTTIVRSEAA